MFILLTIILTNVSIQKNFVRVKFLKFATIKILKVLERSSEYFAIKKGTN